MVPHKTLSLLLLTSNCLGLLVQAEENSINELENISFSSVQRQKRDLVRHSYHHNAVDTRDVTTTGDILANGTTDDSGRTCIKKMMMVEETVYDDVMTCNHKYQERCHESYVTVYEPHQEEECDERYRKVCDISYDTKARVYISHFTRTSNFGLSIRFSRNF